MQCHCTQRLLHSDGVFQREAHALWALTAAAAATVKRKQLHKATALESFVKLWVEEERERRERERETGSEGELVAVYECLRACISLSLGLCIEADTCRKHRHTCVVTNKWRLERNDACHGSAPCVMV